MSHFVVIGAGQAGAALVARLRKQGFEGEITMIGAEAVLPYQRPPLSKAYLLGEIGQERLFLRPESFYAENRIELRLGCRVEAIDVAAREIRCAGEAIGYDQLILTTGATPRRLPAAIGGALAGVHVVRDLQDVDAMAPAVREGARCLVVGGGYIGLEAAAVCRKRGVAVTLVEMADRILQRVASPETAAYFRALHRSHGVDLREATGLVGLMGEEGEVRQAELSDGSVIDVDFVVVGVGVTPSVALAEAAGIEIENGIRVDAQGRSSIEGIWAAGDCASFPYRGERIRLESVPNAIDQAEAVADNLLGADRAYEAAPWFWSDQYDVKLQIAGLGAGFDRVVARKAASDAATGAGVAGAGDAADQASFWYFRGARLLAVDAMNDPRAYMVGKRLIDAGRTVDPALIADPSVDLKSLLRG